MEVTKKDLLEYKQEIEETRNTILESKESGMKAIQVQVQEYKVKLETEFNAQVQKDLDKCEIEEDMIDKIIKKMEDKETL